VPKDTIGERLNARQAGQVSALTFGQWAAAFVVAGAAGVVAAGGVAGLFVAGVLVVGGGVVVSLWPQPLKRASPTTTLATLKQDLRFVIDYSFATAPENCHAKF
jgi:predicted phage tail protein